jgi:hypothetical protein
MKKNIITKSLLISTLLLSCSQNLYGQVPLNFSAEYNNIQILPQKFEYTLLDSSSLKIGDIIIDSKNLNFQLELNPSNPSEGRLIFSWPAGLLKEGELTLFNNYGKSLLKEEITQEKIKIVSGENTTNALLRNEKTTFTTEYLNEEFIEEIKYLPFLKFCMNKKERNTRIELCSSELYVSSEENKLNIKERKSSQREAVVIINGKEVGDQGIIFLNDKNENINFKAQSESGALLEIVTRLKPIDFKDVVITDDKKSLKFKASGSYPVKEEGVKKLGDDLWEITLPVDFPVFYVQGDGGIPMRQEFNIKGILPQEKLRSFLLGSPKAKTYSSNFTIEAKTPKGTTVKAKDDLSKLTLKKNQRLTWELKDLKANELNKRYLLLTSTDAEATIGYDIFRGYRYEAHVTSQILSPLNMIGLGLDLSWWLNNLMSGIAFKYTMALTKPEVITSYSEMEVSYLHRFTKGLNFINPSYFVGIGYKMLKINDTSFATPGFSVGRKNTPTWNWLYAIADWYQWKFQYFLGQKNNNVELKSVYAFDFTNYYSLTTSQSLSYSLGIMKYQLDGDSNLTKDQLTLGLGWNKLF